MNPRMKIKPREIPWGFDGDSTCIYCLGHIPPADFLSAVRQMRNVDSPQDSRDELTEDQVTHTRYRPMSPTECRTYGFTSGVTPAEPGRYGYDVTEVIFP